MAKATKTAEMVPLFGFRSQIEDEPEFKIRAAPVSLRRGGSNIGTDAIDLTDKAKVWLLNGRGGTGKSWLARWLGWRMAEQGRSAVLAALDPGNRSLATWFDNVQQPETADPAHTLRFLMSGIEHLTRSRQSAIMDLGGGDLSLRALVDLAPNFMTPMIEAGVEPIACYCLGSDPDHLAVLGTLEDAGFKPRCTLLILNEVDVENQTREEAFARVLRHSDFQAAVARGDDLTRGNVMRQVANLHDLVVPMLLPGVTINTSPTRFAPINQEQMVRFDGTSWVRFGNIRSAS